MAKKLPIVPVLIGAGAGLATYLGVQQLSQRVQFFQQHPLAGPGVAVAVGVLIAKKHLPVGLGIAGGAGAIGYLQYKAGAQAQPQAQQQTPVQQQTIPTNYQPPAQQTQTQQPTAQTDTTGQQIGQGINALTGGGGDGTQNGAGTGTTGDGTQPASTTSGYSAGKLLSGPRPHSHLANYRRGGAGALMSGPRPASHLAPWHRNAGHYDRPAPGEAGGLRGGAFGLSSD